MRLPKTLKSLFLVTINFNDKYFAVPVLKKISKTFFPTYRFYKKTAVSLRTSPFHSSYCYMGTNFDKKLLHSFPKPVFRLFYNICAVHFSWNALMSDSWHEVTSESKKGSF